MLAAGGLLLVLDQWSKRRAELHVRDRCVPIGRFLHLRYVRTPRGAYQRRHARAALVLGWLAALISAVTLHLSSAWFQSPVALIGLGLALGGAAGNLLDVLRSRAVVDFIDMRWWPVFNLADVAIVGGLVLAVAPNLHPG